MTKNIKTERIDKVLSLSGYGTRKEVKKLIKLGAVSVNGEIVNEPKFHVDPVNDTIRVSGKDLEYKEFIYIMMNKPQDVISSTYDKTTTTIIDLLEGEFSHRNLFPAGRLDKDSEGLILLTDDGQLAHKLLAPKNKVEKVYYVEVKGTLDDSDVAAFENGIVLEDFKAQPAKLEILEAGDISKAKVYIYEGKFHQVKRMVLARGKEVTYLKRLALGSLVLDEDLEPGEWRELTESEISLLYNCV